jgi:hypothetical protein
LPEHGVDEGGFAVVDVGDDGDVANVLGHGACFIRLAWSGMELSPDLWGSSYEHRLKPVLLAQTKIAAGATSSPDESPLSGAVVQILV